MSASERIQPSLSPGFINPPLRTSPRIAPLQASPQMPLRLRRKLASRPRGPAMLSNMPPEEDGPPDDDPGRDDMTVYREGAKKPLSGDLLPFDVQIVSPPPSFLGRFQLDPRTNCGDVVEHNGHHFVVKRVRLRYKYSGGTYQVFRKHIEVKSLARKALESYLERVWNES